MTQPVYESILHKKSKGEKQLAILVDPDGLTDEQIYQKASQINEIKASLIFVGGSYIHEDCLSKTLSILKNEMR